MAMNDFNIGFLAGLDGTKSKAKLNQDIDAIKKSLKELELKAKLDPNQVKVLENQLNSLKVILTNVSFDQTSLNNLVSQINNSLSGIKLQIPNLNTGNVVGQAQQVGQQIGNNIAQGVQSGTAKAASTMKSFAQLADSIQSQDVLFNKEGLQDTKLTLDVIKKTYSEFGQVKITNQTFNLDELQSFKVNIEQVNGELKETRSFMMELNSEGTKFIFPDDVVKGTEKYVQHLNSAKNVINATGDEANALKQKLADQEKYYGNIKKEVNTLYSLKTKLLSADELETAELERQIKSTKQRITYNNQQIDKKGLRDNSLTREINDLEVAKQKQLALAEARLQDSANAKSQARSQKELNATLKEQQSLSAQANKIQLSSDVTKLTTDYQKFGVVSQEVENNLKELKLAQEAVVNAKGTDRLATEIDKYNTKLAETKSSLKELTTTQVSMNQRTSQLTSMQEWMRKNKAATKLVGNEVNKLIEECKTCDAVRFNGIKNEFKDLQVQAGKAEKLGNSLFGSLKDQVKSFTQWISVSGAVMEGIQAFRKATNNVIELDTKMVELSKVSDLTAQGLEDVTNQCYDLGESLSKTGTDVLDAVTTFKRAGYDIADSMKYAEEALKTANISENLKDASQNADSLVNIMKGFQNETPEFAKKINDAVNQVSNTEAVNFDNLIDGATRLSAVADQAGLSFEQMLGTLTGGYEILGNMEKVATGQITIFSRLQAIQLDGEEEVSTVAKLQEKFSNATKGAVNIVDKTSGQLRNVYDILDDLAGVWDSLDKNTREALAIEAAGKIYARICGNTYRESSYIG